ncbi:MAG: glycosyltransferase [Saprospiraceae bacterium]|nr:glycosyltransferase [Saprospiraceae bacterium]
MSEVGITVYITNYNYGKYIRKAVESVLHQTMQDFELLIIDDGSTDNSRSIIESYSTYDKVKIIYQQNKGLNITNNIAMRLASGKYIMRLDADDYLAPNALQEMYAQLEADPDLGLVFPNYFLVDANEERIAEVKRHNFDKEVTLLDQPAHGACTMIRLEFLRAVGGYDEQYSCQDGYELWIKFISRFRVANNSQSLFYYRQHGQNLTTNENRILDTRRKINDNFISKHDIFTPKTIGIIPVRNTKFYANQLAFVKVGGESLLELKIKSLLETELLDRIVITSEDETIENYVEERYANNEKVVFIARTSDLARYNVSLAGTVDLVLNHPTISSRKPEAFMLLPIEYPFLKSEVIDDAINSLSIFNADSLISVRIERSTFYQHHGEGMVPILNQEKFTRLEREALFKAIGGITLCRVSAFEANGKIVGGKVGHITIDEESAFGIFSDFDLKLAELLHQNKRTAISKPQ